MPTLKGYKSFAGRHYETGTLANAFAHMGAIAPHTGKPYSEELLLGVSGGIAFGYFLFDYKGHDPMCNLLTRNTFDPFGTILSRLGVPQQVRQFSTAAKADAGLIEALEGNKPAIVWADRYSLPFTGYAPNSAWWAMLPLLVYGYDGETALTAAGPPVPCRIAAADLRAARARVGKDKHRLMTLEKPDPRKLKDAVQKGIWQCVSLFTDKPPKGAVENFGFAAMKHWSAMLTNTRNVKSWARFFPPGSRLYSALAGSGMTPGVFSWLMEWGFGDGAERGAYAVFLDEAAELLARPALKQAALKFRESALLWQRLADVALPASVPEFGEIRALKAKRRAAYNRQDSGAVAEMQFADTRLREIRDVCGARYPMEPESVSGQLARLSELLIDIHDVEFDAVNRIKGAMA